MPSAPLSDEPPCWLSRSGPQMKARAAVTVPAPSKSARDGAHPGFTDHPRPWGRGPADGSGNRPYRAPRALFAEMHAHRRSLRLSFSWRVT